MCPCCWPGHTPSPSGLAVSASSANSNNRRSNGKAGEHPGLGGSALAEAEGTPCRICLVVGSRGHEDNPQMLPYKSG